MKNHMKKQAHTYKRIISDIQDALNRNPSFVLKKLETRRSKTAVYDLMFVTLKRAFQRRPHVLLMGTLHGEEPAGAVALSSHIGEIFSAALKEGVNLTVIPCGNPFGLDRNVRNAPGFLFMNGGYCHPKFGKMPKGSAAMKKLLKTVRATHYLDLHEDKDSKGVYVYAFKDRMIADKLLRMATRHLPIETRPKMDDRDIRNADIEAGIVFDAHDGTTEDFISHQAQCIFSGALETPSNRVSMALRSRAQADAAIELIRIAGAAKRRRARTKG